VATFVYRSTIHGPYAFEVDDGGGIVTCQSRQLAAFGRYLHPTDHPRCALRADVGTLERVARTWWRNRTGYISMLGHKAGDMKP
jgi:hypothetical protein